ncbi:MAG: MotA/TolQ/ExbB proton channel family protein [Gammaproteobacteria bacterium]|nr:MotA/TolQ/ExbB proton channel family protein [Gammaproteobacteria bacterium]
MGPIVLCSVVALAIVLERLWALRSSRVMPVQVIPQVRSLCRNKEIDAVQLRLLRTGSPLGAVLAEGLSQRGRGRAAVKESIEQAGRQVVHSLERYLNTLGTIAAIAPYLGLLGSILGMIKVFSVFSAAQGVSDPALLARGISEILFATAAGLVVAIPSLMFHRYFHGRVNELALRMEDEALHFLSALECGEGSEVE